MSPQEYLQALFDPAPGPPSSAYLVLVALFLALFAGSAATFAFSRSLFRGNLLHHRLARRFCAYGLVVGAIGLILLAARYLGMNGLQARIFLVFAVLAAVALFGYLAWFTRSRYPSELAAYLETKKRESFVRPGAHSARRHAKKRR